MLIVGKNMPYARKVRNQEFIFTVQKVQNLLKSVYGDFRFSTIRFNIDYGDGGRLSAFPNIYVKYINTSGKSITDDYDKEYSKYINSVFGSETEAVYFIK